MDKLASLWLFVRRRKYLITFVLFVVYRTEYEENTRRLNELAVDSGAIEQIAREKYLMKKPNEDIYVFQEDVEE